MLVEIEIAEAEACQANVPSTSSIRSVLWYATARTARTGGLRCSGAPGSRASAELRLGQCGGLADQAALARDAVEDPPLVLQLRVGGGRDVVGADERDPGLVGDRDEVVHDDRVANRPRQDRRARSRRISTAGAASDPSFRRGRPDPHRPGISGIRIRTPFIVGERRPARRARRSRPPTPSRVAAVPGASAARRRRVHGREDQRGQQVLGDDRRRQFDQHGVDRGQHERDQPGRLAEQLECDQPDQRHRDRAEHRLRVAGRVDRAVAAAPRGRRSGRPARGSTGSRARSTRSGRASRRRRTPASSQRVVAGARDVARQRQVRAGVVDRLIGVPAAASAIRSARATIRIAATSPPFTARGRTAGAGYGLGRARVSGPATPCGGVPSVDPDDPGADPIGRAGAAVPDPRSRPRPARTCSPGTPPGR